MSLENKLGCAGAFIIIVGLFLMIWLTAALSGSSIKEINKRLDRLEQSK